VKDPFLQKAQISSNIHASVCTSRIIIEDTGNWMQKMKINQKMVEQFPFLTKHAS